MAVNNRYCDFKNIKTRSAGRKQFVDIHLIMPEHMSVKKAHQITTALKKDIASTLFESEVAMHIEPCDKDCAYAKNNDQCPYTDSD